MRGKKGIGSTCRLLALGLMCTSFFPVAVGAQEKEEKSNMELVGFNDLQGRSSYQPIIEKQGDRWIAYIGHEAGNAVNSITGKDEPNGTSILDVTDPKNPKYLAHIPGEVYVGPTEAPGITYPGGAEMVRACRGSELPRGDKSKVYLLRNFGQARWEIWDVTDPAQPTRITVVVDGLHNTHKPWWECDTGIAILPGGLKGWPVPLKGSHHDAGNHAYIYDLSDPAKPVFIREFGLPGQEPGSALPPPMGGLHSVLSSGPKGNRVYFSNSMAEDGVLIIADRNKLLNGPKDLTDDNLRDPVVARIDFPPDMGVHSVLPLYHMPLAEFVTQKNPPVDKSFLALIAQGHGGAKECHENRQMLRFFDITTDSKPIGVSTWTVPEASGHFCSRGGSFSPHSTNESFTPIYYEKVLFIAHQNAGVRALDIRDPYNLREIGYYIPAPTSMSRESCWKKDPDKHCAVVSETNNVEVDDRGYIYIVDRDGAGLHILELTGSARQVADFSKAEH
jgi:hypothetical protein